MKSLSIFCRNVRRPLGGGLTLLQVAQLLAKNGPADQRRLGAYLAQHFRQGQSFSDALASYRPALPPLLLSMAEVGEETGRLPETFAALERYYTLQERMVRQLRGRIAMILVQVGLACLVLALVIGITTSLSPQGGFTIFGLRGWGGALAFLGLAAGVVLLLILAVRGFARGMKRSRPLAALAHRLPGLGPFLEALLLSRFALALRLTLDSSLPVVRALRLAFLATADAAYQSAGEEAIAAIRQGRDLYEALAQTRLLPETFIEIVAVAETAGLVPERMAHLAEDYQEEATRRSKSLVFWVTMAAWSVYVAFVVWAIFKMAGVYLRAFN